MSTRGSSPHPTLDTEEGSDTRGQVVWVSMFGLLPARCKTSDHEWTSPPSSRRVEEVGIRRPDSGGGTLGQRRSVGDPP